MAIVAMVMAAKQEMIMAKGMRPARVLSHVVPVSAAMIVTTMCGRVGTGKR